MRLCFAFACATTSPSARGIVWDRRLMRTLRGRAVAFFFYRFYRSCVSLLHQATMILALRAALRTQNASFREIMLINLINCRLVFQVFPFCIRDKRVITTIRSSDAKIEDWWSVGGQFEFSFEEKSSASGEILVYLRKQHRNSQQKRRDPSHNHDLACLAYCARILRSHRMHYRVIPETMSPYYSASARSFKLRSRISYFVLDKQDLASQYSNMPRRWSEDRKCARL